MLSCQATCQVFEDILHTRDSLLFQKKLSSIGGLALKMLHFCNKPKSILIGKKNRYGCIFNQNLILWSVWNILFLKAYAWYMQSSQVEKLNMREILPLSQSKYCLSAAQA